MDNRSSGVRRARTVVTPRCTSALFPKVRSIRKRRPKKKSGANGSRLPFLKDAEEKPKFVRGRMEKLKRKARRKIRKIRGQWWKCDYSALRPLNEAEEKERFLRIFERIQNGDTSSEAVLLDPVFSYSWEEGAGRASALSEKYSVPSFELLDIARGIIDRTVVKYGSEEGFLQSSGGTLLTTEKDVEIIKSYIDTHGLTGQLGVELTYDQVSPTVLRKDCVSVRLPPHYRRGTILGVCNHEIGTHFIRRLNENRQPWYACREKYNLHDALDTEEGLACVNQELHNPLKILWRPALIYYCACMADRMSFVDLFNVLGKYVKDPERRWTYCLRVKRGVFDTSANRAFCKDQVYLKGAVELLSRRHSIDFRLLYTGKIALVDLPSVIDVAVMDGCVLPFFLYDEEDYRRRLDEIAAANGIL